MGESYFYNKVREDGYNSSYLAHQMHYCICSTYFCLLSNGSFTLGFFKGIDVA